MKVQESYILKYLNLRIWQYPLGFIVDKTYNIKELVNEWCKTGNIWNFDTPFRTYSTYEKELMAALPITWNALHKSEMEYNGKFIHTLGRIQHIALMNILDIFMHPVI